MSFSDPPLDQNANFLFRSEHQAMSDSFASFLRLHHDSVVRSWVDAMYRDGRTELTERLSMEQLVNHLPEALDELATLVDHSASDAEIAEAAKRLRVHPQVRFQQGALMDEVAREFITLRSVIHDLFWKPEFLDTESRSEARATLYTINRFLDELVVQTIIVYAASLRPTVETRISNWPPPRRKASISTLEVR